jgi:hypothetical protein
MRNEGGCENLREFVKITQESVYGFIRNTLPLAAATAAGAVALHPDPTYNAIWAAASTFLQMMSYGERETFATEFNIKEIPVEELSSLEFARATKATLEAAANTASEEKLKKLARLLNNGATKGLIQNYDVFKEYAKLIDDISPQEFRILVLLKHHMEGRGAFGVLPIPLTRDDEEKYGKLRKLADEVTITIAAWGDTPQQQKTTLENKWSKAKAKIKEELDASNEALESYMLRLTRTGCIAPVLIPTYESVKTIYRVTPLYISLEDYIKGYE